MSQFQNKNKVSLNESALLSKAGQIRKLFTKAKVEKVYLDYSKLEDGGILPPGVIETIDLKGSKIIKAFPIDETFTSLPVIGEVVEVFRISGKPFYRRLTIISPSINTSADVRDGENLAKNKSTQNRYTTNIGAGSKPIPDINQDEYKNSSVQTNSNSPDQKVLESSFKKQKVQRLKLFEGDTVLQSRFGQSIRFSGYNNELKSVNPTLIIRNGAAKDKSEELKETDSILEDINKDGGTITFSSGKYLSKFVPGSADKNGKSNFELKVWENSEKYALEQYPKKLDGNQIIIASDRLIFSSRTNETIHFSKGPFSIVSDSYFTLDSNKGMNFVSQKGDMQFEAKNLEIKFFVGKKGKIHLGADKDTPTFAIVNGKEIVDILGQFINEFITMCNTGGILTSGGPSSGINPANLAKLKTLMSKLPGTLSKKVFIGM